jgi:hypothetical protein
MKFNFIALITTLVTCMVLAYGWGSFCEANEINWLLRGAVSFSIGLFGSRVIYNWLCTPDKQELESESIEE